MIVHEDQGAIVATTLVSRGVEEREAGEDRLPHVVRAIDVWRQRPRQGQ